MSNVSLRLGVIMAGGSGERFWPLSRYRRPKQLLKLASEDKTLLEEAVDRLLPMIPPERLFIATGEHLRESICEAGLLVPPENILAEPCKRNTAGCLAYVAAHCLHRFGARAVDTSLAITTADHRIGTPETFRQTVEVALKAVEEEPVLAIIGIQPTRADTGYGYIEIAPDAPRWGESIKALPVYRVERFREKPNRAMAEEFLGTGRFFWNSGMFFWRLSTFLMELERVRPGMTLAIREMAAALDRGDGASVRDVFKGLEDISIDYALMEHARHVVMARGDFPWDDIGSWDALGRVLGPDERGNIVVGDAVIIESKDCVVYNERGAERVAVGVLGVDGLVVVVAEDGVLVIPKERSQDVRQIVAELRERGAPQI
jgi:mannose-1-phosphate guanylyltransferase